MMEQKQIPDLSGVLPLIDESYEQIGIKNASKLIGISIIACYAYFPCFGS